MSRVTQRMIYACHHAKQHPPWPPHPVQSWHKYFINKSRQKYEWVMWHNKEHATEAYSPVTHIGLVSSACRPFLNEYRALWTAYSPVTHLGLFSSASRPFLNEHRALLTETHPATSLIHWCTHPANFLDSHGMSSLDSHGMSSLLIHMGIEEVAGWVLSWFTCQSLDSHGMSSLDSHGMSSLLIHMSISWFTWDEFSIDSHVNLLIHMGWVLSWFTCGSTKSLTWWIKKVTDLRDSDLFEMCTGLFCSLHRALWGVCLALCSLYRTLWSVCRAYDLRDSDLQTLYTRAWHPPTPLSLPPHTC